MRLATLSNLDKSCLDQAPRRGLSGPRRFGIRGCEGCASGQGGTGCQSGLSLLACSGQSSGHNVGVDMHYAELSRTIDAAELGRRIRHARGAAGLTQSPLAGADASAAYVSRIEAGQRRPEAGLLERMATRLDVGLEQLLGEEATPAGAAGRPGGGKARPS